MNEKLKNDEFHLKFEFEDGYTGECVTLEKKTNDGCDENQFQAVCRTFTDFLRDCGFSISNNYILFPVTENEYEEIKEMRREEALTE